MQIRPVTHQGASSISSREQTAPTSQLKSIYGRSSLRSMRYPGTSLGRALTQIFEGVAMMMMLPFFIYTFFIVSMSIVFLPLMIVLVPFIIVGDLMREILHTILPWVFPDPRYRYN